MEKLSLYIHIPFCLRRCGYCDFNTFAGVTSLIPSYINAVCQELQAVLGNQPSDLLVHTIYFGGGTPSLITIDQYDKVFNSIQKLIPVSEDAEISLEANPGTVNKEYLEGLREVGFNRISFGMQSSSPFDLKTLDREHKYEDVVNAVKWSKQAGLTNINLDLIFGIPGQTIESWMRSLDLAMMFEVSHLSIYSLIIEDGTPLKSWIDRGLVLAPEEDDAAEMYIRTMQFLEGQGFSQYEISNWSRNEGSQCQHNLQYWRFLPYLGFGAGAHGFWHNTRTENTRGIQDYISKTIVPNVKLFPAGPANLETMLLSKWERLQENLMMSLRLTEEGISSIDFKSRYGVEIKELFPQPLEKLTRMGLIESDNNGNAIRLTWKGCLLGNRVFSEFVGNVPPAGYEYLDSQYT